MEVVSSLVNTAMGKVLCLVRPDSHGACALLPRLTDELDELKHLQATAALLFPGSTRPPSTPPQRRIWMEQIYKDRPIGQIVWPATHHSATNKIGLNFITRPFVQHQTLSIYYQLENGVRALHIRLQQDGLVCNGNFLTYSIDDVITDIKKFLSETHYEIIILEIQTESGYTDPPDFETNLVAKLGDRLIKQDDRVFSRTISQVLPGRIICIWKPKNSPRPRAGGPVWSASYLRDDKFETELPLTKFRGNLTHLEQQSPASERNYFYKVENILTPQASSAGNEWMLVWPRHANVLSKRINDFASLFLAKCKSQGILDRLQIYSTDFITDDFIIDCIALNHSMVIKAQSSQYEETTQPISRENIKQAVKAENLTQMQWEKEEVKSKCMEMELKLKTAVDEKVQMDASVKSIFKERESLTRKMEVATGKLKMMEKHSQDLELKFEKEQADLKEKNTSLEMKLKSAEKDKEHLQKHRQELEQKVKNLEVQLQTKLDSIENMQKAVSNEKNRATRIQWDMDELKNKFKDEKVHMEAAKNSMLIEKETLLRELGDARKQLEKTQKRCQEQEEMLTEELDGARKLLEKKQKHCQELELILKAKVPDPTTTSENKNIFMVLPRDVQLEDHSAWKWSYLTETSSAAVVEVPDLVQVYWLKVFGTFNTEKLSKGIKYEVAFVVMLKNSASGWENPVNLLLSLPDGTTQRNQENLNLKARDKWLELPVGSFIMTSNMSGNLKFALEERAKELKKGLVIKGVVIQKKYKTKIVYPRDLVISSYENRQCWKWQCLYERDEAVEVAELIKVSRLEVSGKFEISSLLPGCTYEVAYVIMLKNTAYEWKAPLNLSLLLPNGNKVEREESLEKCPREEWITISAGIFKKTGNKSGFVEFSLFNFDETPKFGLLIKSVVIQQKIF